MLNADQHFGHRRFSSQILAFQSLPRSSDLAAVGSGGQVLGARRDSSRDSHVAPGGAVLKRLHIGKIADLNLAMPSFRRDRDSSTAQNANDGDLPSRRCASASELGAGFGDRARTATGLTELVNTFRDRVREEARKRTSANLKPSANGSCSGSPAAASPRCFLRAMRRAALVPSDSPADWKSCPRPR